MHYLKKFEQILHVSAYMIPDDEKEDIIETITKYDD